MINIQRYGFIIDLDFNREYSGLHWIASSDEDKECGEISFSLLKKNKKIFVETSFTPLKVDIFPIFSNSKYAKIDHIDLLPGRWNFQFLNLVSTDCTLGIFASSKNSYDGKEIIHIKDLTKTGIVKFDIEFLQPYEKIFIKKYNYAESKIQISDLSFFKDGVKYITDPSLITCESKNIFQKNGIIEFSELASIWSFCTVKFYELNK